jgi:carbonic anhydrase/acetyltransferase-like protein (isoleucine patch superfamily)
MDARTMLGRLLLTMGPTGVGRSLYLSLAETGRPDSILVGRRVLTRVKGDVTVGSGSRLLVGVHTPGASHERIGRSKFTVADGASVTVDCTDGTFKIGPASVVHVEGDLVVGNSYLNSHARILCGERVEIGDGCAIAWNVQFVDDDRHQLSVADEQRPRTAPIVVEDDVWIGHGVTVKKGVTVGEGAVVASNSVVTNDVPPGVLVAGQPATVVREDVTWS